MLQNQPYGTRASELEVARYQKLVKSAEFVAWREEQEAQRVLAAPQAAAHQPRR
jgi:cytochrome c-type biogenesis protein CcmH/NrfG